MTITEKLYSILSGMSDLVALVAAENIRTPGPHQDLVPPYLIHFPVALDPTQTHEGQQPLSIWDFYQISVFAPDYPTGEEIAQVIRLQLPGVYDGVHIFLRPGATFFMEDRDKDEQERARTFHFVLEFTIAEALSADT